jgi:hypothetical protein
MRSRPRSAMRPSHAFISRPFEGVGNAGCPLHPRSRVHFVLVERTRLTTSTPERPAFPHAMVLRLMSRSPPVTGLFCHRRQRISGCPRPVGPTCHPANLTPASGRHDHTILPSAKSVSRQRAIDPSRIQRTRPAIPSRAKRCRVHRIQPRVRDDHDTPLLWGGMRKVLDVIWGV